MSEYEAALLELSEDYWADRLANMPDWEIWLHCVYSGVDVNAEIEHTRKVIDDTLARFRATTPQHAAKEE